MFFEIELIETYGMKTALQALRRPMNIEPVGNSEPSEDDLRIMTALVKQGDDHAKFARMIGAGFTIRAPRYWWIEFATYRIGIESVSESTMHRKISEPFKYDDFEDGGIFLGTLEQLNIAREHIDSKFLVYELKQMLPEGFLQTRDIVANYQTLRHIYWGRKDHKLPHWQEFCKFIETLPYSEQLITVR